MILSKDLLEFKFSQKPKAEIQNQIKSGLKSQGIETEFLEKLLNEVVEWSISGEKIDRETVLKQLGIANRFIDRISHYFEVDDKYYVPNEDLLQKLENAITELLIQFIITAMYLMTKTVLAN